MPASLKDFSAFSKISTDRLGNVFFATQTAQARKVLIKQCPLNILRDPNSVKDVEIKVKSAARLDHENIIKVIDFRYDEQSFFIIMEHVDGPDLQQIMHWQPFPGEIGLMILLQAMKGLNHAHKNRTIHCNLKPANILIAKNGTVKIIDFGLSHTISLECTDLSSGLIAPRYMAPEVAAGSRMRGIFTDIWSIGILAYRIMCGAVPFNEDDIRKLVHSIVYEKERNISEIVPTLPEDLAFEVGACLEKDPRNRPPSLDKLIICVEDYLGDIGIQDIEKTIGDYIADRQAAAQALSGQLFRFHRLRGKQYLDSGNRALSNAHFMEAEKFSAPRTESRASKITRMPRERISGLYPKRIESKPVIPGIEKLKLPAMGIFALLKKNRTTALIAGSVALVALIVITASIVFTSGNNQAGNQAEGIPQPAKSGIREAAGQPRVESAPAPVAPASSFASAQVVTTPAASSPSPAEEPAPVSSPAPRPQGALRALRAQGAQGAQNVTIEEKSKRKPAYQASPRKTAPLAQEERRPAFSAGTMKYGTFQFSIDPANAVVFVDGEKLSFDQIEEGKRVKPGRHIIGVSAHGYDSYKSVHTVEPNAVQAVSVSLKPVATEPGTEPSAGGTGLLHVNSYPWAEIYIDNVFQGTTPTPNPITLPAGEHTVVLKHDGYKTYTGLVHVGKGDTARVKIQLEQ